ncbi:MAG: MATE family efflux transporter [Clostridia bacterium]|nr:MATE family efflux transporter [Clostridia bacterium]
MTKELKFKDYIFGDRKFYSHVIKILIPIIIQNTVTNVVSLLDNVMVGRVGTLEMSAVAIVNQLLFIFYICIFGGISGAGIFSAQFAGAEDHEGVKNCFRFKTYIAFTMFSVALAVFIIFPEQLISMYLAEETSPADAAATMNFARDYLFVMLFGILPFALSQVYGSTLRETGETKLPMIASVAAILVNLVFNYILIFGNKGLPFLPFEPMGVVGAAIATVISRFIELLIIILAVHRKNNKYEFTRKLWASFKIPRGLTLNIFKKGTPLLANEFLWSLGVAMLLQCYSVRGLDVVAATNITQTVANLFNVVFLSIGNAVAIMVGQQLGAGKTEEAKLSVWRLLSLTVISCIVMGGLMILTAPFIPRIYNTTETVRHTATELLDVVAVAMPFMGFSHTCYFTLRSGGKTFITLIFDCAFMWFGSFATAFILAHYTSLPIIPLYAIVQSLEIIKCIIGFVLIKKGVWVNNLAKQAT